ncbi:MAG: GNAT family N-acetyltransferase, partial [Leptolyngbya sp. SIO1D8]|nr:GNAT family N-acetyltransferase [Leptolyngbya sp. SIO1D8]
MTFEIRKIQPQDNTRLAAIIRQILAEFGANRPGFAWSDPELDTLSEAYSSESSIYYVVTQQQEIVGGAGIAPFPCEHPHLCELQKMYLLPDQRGQGIGKALIDKLLQIAQVKGYHGCYLETFDAMRSAIRLYE